MDRADSAYLGRDLGLTAFVTGTWSFLGVRFLLGLAEAGFYPGIILYLTWGFPSSYRSRIVGIFMTAIPISIITGSLVSSQVLRLGAWGGLQRWQWLFILEAIPAVVLGFVVLIYLTDGPCVGQLNGEKAKPITLHSIYRHTIKL